MSYNPQAYTQLEQAEREQAEQYMLKIATIIDSLNNFGPEKPAEENNYKVAPIEVEGGPPLISNDNGLTLNIYNSEGVEGEIIYNRSAGEFGTNFQVFISLPDNPTIAMTFRSGVCNMPWPVVDKTIGLPDLVELQAQIESQHNKKTAFCAVGIGLIEDKKSWLFKVASLDGGMFDTTYKPENSAPIARILEKTKPQFQRFAKIIALGGSAGIERKLEELRL